MGKISAVVVAALCLAAMACGQDAAVRGQDPAWLARSSRGMVASDSSEASQIGAQVLSSGGNAFDAAVATSLALTVTRPESTGIGGGGFMVAYIAKEKRFVALDFREMAPQAATLEHFQQLRTDRPNAPSPSLYGGNAVGVPGQVAGLAEINRRFGTKPFSELTRPAAALAAVGVLVDAHYRSACRSTAKKYDDMPLLRASCAPFYDKILRGGAIPRIGDRVQRPKLSATLIEIGRNGPDAFYTGEIGDALLKAVQKAGGVMTAADLAGYRVIERPPLRANVGDFEIVTMPPPSSGGVCIIEALNVLRCATKDSGGLAALRDSPMYAPLLVYSFKHAFADRARWLGDPDFTQLPVQRLIDPAYACKLVSRGRKDVSEYGSTQLPDDSGTSHFCVVDKEGNIVSITETVNATFGSLVLVEPYGIILNNQMDDFSTAPGEPNLFGLIQGEANVVGPGKRPLSSMSPTIALKDDKPVLVLGGSGGPRIITAVFQVMLDVMQFNTPLSTAMQRARLHHQWMPNEVYFDGDPPQDYLDALKLAREPVSDKRESAAVQAIQIEDDGTLIGASDPRKGGRPQGVK